MSLPSVRLSGTAISQIPDGFTRSEGKALVQQQNREVARGLVTTSRIQAAALAAGVGIQCVGMLSREIAFQSDGDPAATARMNHIGDQYAGFVGNELARFGLGG